MMKMVEYTSFELEWLLDAKFCEIRHISVYGDTKMQENTQKMGKKRRKSKENAKNLLIFFNVFGIIKK